MGQRCRFENCNFVYSGGPFAFSECELVAGALSLMGSARWTSKLLAKFAEGIVETEWPG